MRKQIKGARRRRSGAELTEMMVGVEESPTEPFAFPHHAENWMHNAASARVIFAESPDENEQLGAIAVKVPGRGSSDALLDFRPRRKPSGPRNGRPQAAPFHQRPLHKSSREAGGPFAHARFKGIIQVANHLMNGHATPLSGTGKLNRSDTPEDGISICRVGQGSHRAILPRGRGNGIEEKDCQSRSYFAATTTSVKSS